jgi:hypothetical protein
MKLTKITLIIVLILLLLLLIYSIMKFKKKEQFYDEVDEDFVFEISGSPDSDSVMTGVMSGSEITGGTHSTKHIRHSSDDLLFIFYIKNENFIKMVGIDYNTDLPAIRTEGRSKAIGDDVDINDYNRQQITDAWDNSEVKNISHEDYSLRVSFYRNDGPDVTTKAIITAFSDTSPSRVYSTRFVEHISIDKLFIFYDTELYLSITKLVMVGIDYNERIPIRIDGRSFYEEEIIDINNYTRQQISDAWDNARLKNISHDTYSITFVSDQNKNISNFIKLPDNMTIKDTEYESEQGGSGVLNTPVEVQEWINNNTDKNIYGYLKYTNDTFAVLVQGGKNVGKEVPNNTIEEVFFNKYSSPGPSAVRIQGDMLITDFIEVASGKAITDCSWQSISGAQNSGSGYLENMVEAQEWINNNSDIEIKGVWEHNDGRVAVIVSGAGTIGPAHPNSNIKNVLINPHSLSLTHDAPDTTDSSAIYNSIIETPENGPPTPPTEDDTESGPPTPQSIGLEDVVGNYNTNWYSNCESLEYLAGSSNCSQDCIIRDNRVMGDYCTCYNCCANLRENCITNKHCLQNSKFFSDIECL